MKMNTLLSTTALIVSLAFSQSAYAQQAAAPKAAPAATAPAPTASAPANNQGVAAKLPADKAKIYKDGIDALHAKNKSLYEQSVKLRQDMRAIMTADKFDKAAYVAKNAEVEKVFAQMSSNRTEAIASIAAQFTADERKILSSANRQQQRRQPAQGKPAGK